MALCLLPPSIRRSSKGIWAAAWPEDPGEKLDGVGPALIDVEARMPAAQAGDFQPIGVFELGFLSFQREDDFGVGASGAADGERPFLFAVEIDQVFALERAGLDAPGARSARFPHRP